MLPQTCGLYLQVGAMETPAGPGTMWAATVSMVSCTATNYNFLLCGRAVPHHIPKYGRGYLQVVLS